MADRKPARQQPDSFAWTEENKAWCETQIAKFPEGRQASAVIPFLWRAQKQEGWVSIPAMEAIASQLGMPYIRVYEVATFYTMYNLAPVGKWFLQACTTTPCWLRGSDDVMRCIKDKLGLSKNFQSTADGQFTLEAPGGSGIRYDSRGGPEAILESLGLPASQIR